MSVKLGGVLGILLSRDQMGYDVVVGGQVDVLKIQEHLVQRWTKKHSVVKYLIGKLQQKSHERESQRVLD